MPMTRIAQAAAAFAAAAILHAGVASAGPKAIVRAYNGLAISHNSGFPDVTYGTDFGKVTIENDACDVHFVIQNDGDQPLTITGAIGFAGPDAADFCTTLAPTPGTELLPGNNQLMTFTILFDPSSPGIKNATVTIPTSDANANPYMFGIRGEATATPGAPEVNLLTYFAGPAKVRCDKYNTCWLTGKVVVTNGDTGTVDLEGGVVKILAGAFDTLDPGDLLAFVPIEKRIKLYRSKKIRFRIQIPNPDGYEKAFAIVAPPLGLAEDDPEDNSAVVEIGASLIGLTRPRSETAAKNKTD